jgi:hypothetical protein
MIWAKELMGFVYEISLSYSLGCLTCRQILRHWAKCFTSPPKKGVLLVFIAFEKSIASVGLESANLGSNGKHANPYTTDAINMSLNHVVCFRIPKSYKGSNEMSI